MLKNKKQVRADSGEITERTIALPRRPQPAPPVEYVLFEPSPALPKGRSNEAEETEGNKEGGKVDAEALDEEDSQTRVRIWCLRLLIRC